MKITSLIAVAALGSAFAFSPALAQQNTQGVDPSCMMKDSSGADVIDRTKCPDGKTVGSTTGTTTGEAAQPPAGSTTGDSAAQGTQDNTTTGSTSAAPDTSSTSMSQSIIVPQDTLKTATLITSSDFVGRRIYSKAGDDLGEVNDIVFSADGKVMAVILGVGGFLGIGEKDVLVSLNAIQFTKDGDNARLVVDGSKDLFNTAPAFNRNARTYSSN